MASRKPDFDLCYLNKTSEERARIGAAWMNENGSIRIVINPLVVIPPGSDTVLTLFPKKSKQQEDEF